MKINVSELASQITNLVLKPGGLFKHVEVKFSNVEFLEMGDPNITDESVVLQEFADESGKVTSRSLLVPTTDGDLTRIPCRMNVKKEKYTISSFIALRERKWEIGEHSGIIQKGQHQLFAH